MLRVKLVSFEVEAQKLFVCYLFDLGRCERNDVNVKSNFVFRQHGGSLRRVFIVFGHVAASFHEVPSVRTNTLIVTLQTNMKGTLRLQARNAYGPLFFGHGVMAGIPWPLSQSKLWNCIIQLSIFF